MKNIFTLVLSLSVFCMNVAAQARRFYYPDAFYFVKEVNVKKEAGKQYRFEIAVKENPADEKSKPRIYAIQAKKYKQDVIGKTLQYASGNGEGWKTYLAEGVIDSSATRIWLYAAVNGNGNFYFDKLQYALKDTSGNWIYQPLSNASFEEGGKKLLKGYFSKKSATDLKITSSTDAFEGKASLQVLVAGMKVANVYENTPVKQ